MPPRQPVAASPPDATITPDPRHEQAATPAPEQPAAAGRHAAEPPDSQGPQQPPSAGPAPAGGAADRPDRPSGEGLGRAGQAAAAGRKAAGAGASRRPAGAAGGRSGSSGRAAGSGGRATARGAAARAAAAAVAEFPRPTRISEQLITENLNLARSRAAAWASRCREPYEDLEAAAFVGLMRACRRYDPTKGARISTFCWPYINGAIQHHLRDRGHLVRYPRLWRVAWGRVSWLLGQEGATIESVAQELGLDRDELAEMAGAMGQDRGVLNEEVVGGNALEALEDDDPWGTLRPVDQAVEQALSAMPRHDHDALLAWLDVFGRRRQIPQQQIRSFLAACRNRCLRGLRLVEFRQKNLLSGRPEPLQPQAPRRRSGSPPAAVAPEGVPPGWEDRQRVLRERHQEKARARGELTAAAVQRSLVPEEELQRLRREP